jgi:VRR-NUC domain
MAKGAKVDTIFFNVYAGAAPENRRKDCKAVLILKDFRKIFMKKTEQSCRERYEKEGWTLVKNGWPDFLAVREVDDKIEAKGVEVKGVYPYGVQALSPEQEVMREWFKKLGIEYEIAYVTVGQQESDLANEQKEMKRRVAKRQRRKTLKMKRDEDARDIEVLAVLKGKGVAKP